MSLVSPCPVLMFAPVQEATAATITPALGMVHFCLECGLSQDQGYQWIGLLLFCPFLAHDGPHLAADLASILARPSASYFHQDRGCR